MRKGKKEGCGWALLRSPLGSLGLGKGQDLETVATGSGETATACLGPRVF